MSEASMFAMSDGGKASAGPSLIRHPRPAGISEMAPPLPLTKRHLPELHKPTQNGRQSAPSGSHPLPAQNSS